MTRPGDARTKEASSCCRSARNRSPSVFARHGTLLEDWPRVSILSSSFRLELNGPGVEITIFSGVREEPGRVLARELPGIGKEALEVECNGHQPLSVDIVLQLLDHRPTFIRRDRLARDHQPGGSRVYHERGMILCR
jgi:hypothetical protein